MMSGIKTVLLASLPVFAFSAGAAATASANPQFAHAPEAFTYSGGAVKLDTGKHEVLRKSTSGNGEIVTVTLGLALISFNECDTELSGSKLVCTTPGQASGLASIHR